MHTLRAYVNASGRPKAYLITHDIKRAIQESKLSQGFINVLSTQGTTAVLLLENHDTILMELVAQWQKRFLDLPEGSKDSELRSGASKFYLMAAEGGGSVTLPFAMGRLLVSPKQEVFAVDFGNVAGRRELVISVLGEGGQEEQ